MRFEFSDLVDLAGDLGVLRVGHGSVRGSFFQMRRRSIRHGRGRDHQRLFLAQGVGEQAEGSDFAGRIHPDFLAAHREHGDHVIELRGRRDVGIELQAGIDENRIRVKAFGFEKRCEQRVLVFAIAVLIVKNVGGSVGLVAADTEGKAHIAEVLRNVVV